MAWWPWGRNRREPAAGTAPAMPPMISSPGTDDAWRDLPALQRALADPIRPVAISDDFPDSLSSYADPSFVAPLTHQVDPEAGGLVEGLVAPGVPYAHASGPELAVPARPKPAVTRRVGRSTSAVLGSSKGLGHIDTPPVQRSVIASGSTGLSTVALELPGTESSAPESQLSADPEALTALEASAPAAAMQPANLPPTPTSTQPDTETPSETPSAAELRSSPLTVSADAPLIDVESTSRWGLEGSSGGGVGSSEVAASATPTRELPVVARTVDQSMGPEPRRPPRNRESVVPLSAAPGPSTPSAEQPVISRSVDPLAQWAPLSGFAEAITKLTVPGEAQEVQSEASDDHLGSTHDHVSSVDHPESARNHAVSDHDHPAPAALPVPGVPIQRLATGSQPAGAKAERGTTPSPGSSLPVVSRQIGSSSPEAARQAETETRSDAPTLGVRLAQAPLPLQKAPMTERVSARVEPAVQRLEFVTPHVAPVRQAGAGSVASALAQSPVPAPARTPPTPALTPPTPASAEPATHFTELLAQRLPSQDGKRVPNSPARHSIAVSRWETRVTDVISDATVQRLESPAQRLEPPVQSIDPPVQRLQSTVQRVRSLVQRPGSPESVASRPAAPVTLSVSPHVTSEPMGPAAHAVDKYLPTGPAVGELLMGSTFAEVATPPAVQELATAPVVQEMPIGPAVLPEPWTNLSRTDALESPVKTGDSSLPMVSRLAADTPMYTGLRSAGSSPTVAIGPAIPQIRPNAPSSQRSSGAMSFASIFGSAGGTESGSAADGGSTSVQLQSAGESAPTASEPAGDTSSTTPVSSTAPPAGAAPTPVDLDEMARRLYEPLSARLRAELWLDRERAGVMSNG